MGDSLITLVTIAILVGMALIYFTKRAFHFLINLRSKRRKLYKKRNKTLSHVPENVVNYVFSVLKNENLYEKTLTNEKLEFGQFDFGTDLKKVLKSKGSHAFIEKMEIEGIEFKSILYKHKIDEFNRISIYYFANKQLFAGEYYYDIKIPEKTFNFIEILKRKYSINPLSQKFEIEAPYKSKIFFEMLDLELRILYLSDLSLLPMDIEQKSIEYERNKIKKTKSTAESKLNERLYKSL